MEINHLSSQFAATAQLRETDLAEAKALGFGTIVANRPDGEAPDQPDSQSMEQAAHKLGLGFAYIPIKPGELADHHAHELRQVLTTMAHPALAYCRSGARSAALWERLQSLPPEHPKLSN